MQLSGVGAATVIAARVFKSFSALSFQRSLLGGGCAGATLRMDVMRSDAHAYGLSLGGCACPRIACMGVSFMVAMPDWPCFS